jgi:NAD-dependent SIR2 family protein deacetylase
MFTRKGVKTFIKNSYSENIKKALNILDNAEKIVCGVGAGLTSSGGINYMDTEHLKTFYPQYYNLGFKNIFDVMSMFWKLTEDNVLNYWAFWAHHINHVRFETSVMKPYQDLYALLKGKDYFICSTNVDGQLKKAGFKDNKIFAPQGDYAYLQCKTPCNNNIFYNKRIIQNILENMEGSYSIQKDDIPYCSNCEDYLIPNLRSDNLFVEKPYLKNYNKYMNYLNDAKNQDTIFLELGVGFNTPIIIRYPFENMVSKYPNCTLIRVNLNDIMSLHDQGNTIILQEDLAKVLKDLTF